MARAKKANAANGAGPGRAMWSGTVSFGLVSIPVNLHTGIRHIGISLRMLDSDGTPLKRLYVCSVEDEELPPEHIVRGYEIENDKFVVVTDDELEAVAPEKSSDIDLQRFVKLAEI